MIRLNFFMVTNDWFGIIKIALSVQQVKCLLHQYRFADSNLPACLHPEIISPARHTFGCPYHILQTCLLVPGDDVYCSSAGIMEGDCNGPGRIKRIFEVLKSGKGIWVGSNL